MSFELRSDVQALRFGEFVTWAKLVVRVSVGPEGKFSLGYFPHAGSICGWLSSHLCGSFRKVLQSPAKTGAQWDCPTVFTDNVAQKYGE